MKAFTYPELTPQAAAKALKCLDTYYECMMNSLEYAKKHALHMVDFYEKACFRIITENDSKLSGFLFQQDGSLISHS